MKYEGGQGGGVVKLTPQRKNCLQKANFQVNFPNFLHGAQCSSFSRTIVYSNLAISSQLFYTTVCSK